ncbi:MAG TPA: ABC transporter ATP-binding protein [Lachnospiraceae bacterium]|nr:ABC transporter ATP-binding protein [Lachnospiraceae bacterium]
MKHKSHSFRAVIKKIIRKNLPLSAGMAAAIAGSVIIGLLPPLVLQKIVDRLAGGKAIEAALIVLYAALLAVSGIFNAAKESLITIFGQKVTHGIRSAMCGKMTRLPAAYFAENETGVISSRFVNDVDTVEDLFDSGIISMFADICNVVSILIVLFFISRGLGFLMVAVTPLLMLLTLFVQKRMLKAQIENRVAVGRANNHIPETIRNIRMLHTNCAEAFMEKRYSGYIEEGFEAVEKSNFYDAVYSPVIITISAVLIAAVMIFSAMGGDMRVFFGMSAGTAVAVISYVGKVFDPLESIGMEIQNIQSAAAGIFRINEFLETPERKMPPEERNETLEKDGPVCIRDNAETPECGGNAAGSLQSLKSRDGKTWDEKIQDDKISDSKIQETAIEFSHVAFGYTRDREILEDLSFIIRKGETVTLTGRTGLGKSTVFKLILGLYNPKEGSVRIFGKPVNELPDSVRASLIGYVEQAFRQIPGSVRDQVTLKDGSVPEEKVQRALEISGLSQSVSEFPGGLDTLYSEELFSQGQIQLLSIARAIVHDPQILLLDEITSNLDTETEEKVISALKKAASGRTVLSISHRVFGRKDDTEEVQNGQTLNFVRGQ